MVEKIITVYLDSHAYMGGKILAGTFGEKHGMVEEHLSHYLESGWKIKEVHSLGGADSNTVRGWLIVVLHNDE
ncbi:MAG TPA: hypothetical protein EYN58_01265 [Candidatus Poseidoniales archaeon]|jgi:hypothetical protein|nr:MAG: hypothetical protein CXX81_24470 [Euryarchaeota archaeon]PXY78471.1 MAG: hypothetical protein CXX81_07585 [Euryarchaeota archaeon]HHZ73816.1 hypothetical protein [Candidatus Poseidoniales archaeon]HIO57053.1 hypothetical protein [Candidatus Poseidoniales archaeon]